MATLYTGDRNKKPGENLPIGYWLKQADNLLTERINAIQAANGINRTEWQVINLLSAGERAPGQLCEKLQPFTGKDNLHGLLGELVAKEIIEVNNGNYLLTSKGREVYDACFKQQQEFRMKTMEGISAEDYATTLETLQKIVTNLSHK
jgi:DNA-binding MarR family transcriptional regulator